jgi:hypothetical protein
VSEHASYRHTQVFTAMWLLLPLSACVVSVVALRGGDAHQIEAMAIAWGVCIVGLAGLGRLVIELRGDRLRWRFGYLGWPRWELALREIELLQCVHVSRWRGAGIKGLGKDRLFNVSIGGPALRLTLGHNRVVTLGTPEPERLMGFIEARRTAGP